MTSIMSKSNNILLTNNRHQTMLNCAFFDSFFCLTHWGFGQLNIASNQVTKQLVKEAADEVDGHKFNRIF